MDSGYDAAGEEALAAFLAKFTLDEWNEGGALQKSIAPLVMRRARAGASANSWSADATMQAYIYKGVALMIEGLDSRGAFTAAQTDNLRAAYRAPKGQKIAALMREVDQLPADGVEAERFRREAATMVIDWMVQQGMTPTDEVATHVAAWMVAQQQLEASRLAFERL